MFILDVWRGHSGELSVLQLRRTQELLLLCCAGNFSAAFIQLCGVGASDVECCCGKRGQPVSDTDDGHGRLDGACGSYSLVEV